MRERGHNRSPILTSSVMVNLPPQLLGNRISVRDCNSQTSVPDMLILNYSIRTQVIAGDLFEATIVASSMAPIGTHNQ